ncbi:GNAT family N-acetyltransferase [Ideonella sp. DXS22W]|uniref:GNAT family N-acetyltransferase n=1 Tax=Pseudaquabacterium inlustre TaxID=2984192 RepID=A0ABU9CDF1_9BURK
MPPSFRIDPACASDAAAFIDLRGRTRENAVSAARLASIGITEESWAKDIESGVLAGFTATRQGGLVGYCFGDTQTGEVVVLALLPDAEGCGLGRQLLQRVVQELHSCGHQNLFLGCSTDPKVRSYGFYRHLGWQPTGAVDSNNDEVLELRLSSRQHPTGEA